MRTNLSPKRDNTTSTGLIYGPLRLRAVAGSARRGEKVCAYGSVEEKEAADYAADQNHDSEKPLAGRARGDGTRRRDARLAVRPRRDHAARATAEAAEGAGRQTREGVTASWR